MPAPTLNIQTEIVRALSSADQKHLRALEARVESSLMDFAVALYEIRTYKEGLLWRQEFGSFEEYAQARFSYQKQHAYRLAAAGEFVSKLDTLASSAPKPLRESQVRPIINKLPEEHHVSFWKELVRGHTPEELTGEYIERRVKAFQATLPKTEIKIAKKPKSLKLDEALLQDRAKAKGLALVAKLEAAVSPLPRHSEISALLKSIAKLLKRKS